MTCTVFKKGQYWHYRYQIKPFKRVQRSTRLRNKRAAQELATQAYDEAKLVSNGGKPIPTLQQVIDKWMQLRAPTMSAAHVASVEIFARKHLYGLGALRLDHLTKERVETARLAYLAKCNKASANHWLRILKLLINWADALPRLPFKLTAFKVQKTPRVILPVAHVDAWFAAVDHSSRRRPGVAVLVRLMLWLGLRECEAISARWEWFDWDRQTYTPGKTKGFEADPLPLLPRLMEYLLPLRRAEGLVATRANGEPLPAGFAGTAMHHANTACGTSGVTPHRLRGTIATLMSEAGAPLQDIQKFLRHKDPLTTMAYLEKNMDRVRKAQGVIADRIEQAGRWSGAVQESNP